MHVQVSDDPRVGTELAGYRIESLLGWGGMSVVYLAEDLRLKRRVALKLLAAGLAEDESFRDRFLRESELAASIDHPNIVRIYEAGTTDELLFIAMRYVEGVTWESASTAAGWTLRMRSAFSRRSQARWMRPTRAVSCIET
jgi:serine/threonine protein kinase